MTVVKVSIRHPHFPEDTEFGIEGVGRLTNDGTPVEVDEDEYEATTGVPLSEGLVANEFFTVEGGSSSSSSSSKSGDIPGVTSPAKEEEPAEGGES